jgi:hypothetical protein
MLWEVEPATLDVMSWKFLLTITGLSIPLLVAVSLNLAGFVVTPTDFELKIFSMTLGFSFVSVEDEKEISSLTRRFKELIWTKSKTRSEQHKIFFIFLYFVRNQI